MEEYEDRDERGDQDREDPLHRQVALRAFYRSRGGFVAPPQFRYGQPYGLADDLRLLDDADDARHGDASDAERFADEGEEVFCREDAGGVGEDVGARHAQQRGHGRRVDRVGQRPDERYDEEPHQARTRRDDHGVFQSDDVAQAQYGGRRVEREYHLELVGCHLSPRADARRYRLRPHAERAYREVVEAAYETCHGQQFGLVAALLARDQHLGRGRSLGEGVFPVHLLDEIFAERDQQHDSQQPAEERREEHLVKCRVEPEDVERREGEDGTRDDHARRSADRLDDDVLSQHVLFTQYVAHADGDDGDRDRRFEYLSDLQAEKCRRGREDDGHDDAHRDRIGRHLAGRRRGGHDGRVLFARFEFPVSVLGQ